jgi:thymidylate synthase ThyX
MADRAERGQGGHMKSKLKKQLDNRNRLARKLLLAELRLSKHYRQELKNPASAMLPEEREYKQRVVAASDKVKVYCQNFPDADFKMKFLDTLISGENRMITLDENEKVEVPYYEWRNKIIAVEGKAMNIWL